MAASIRGLGTLTVSTGGITVPLPNHQAGDLLLLLVNTANQAVLTPSGWTNINSAGLGTAAAAGAVWLGVYYKYAASSSEPSVSVADSGALTIGLALAIKDVQASGPIDAQVINTRSAASTITLGGVTTTADDELVLFLVAMDRDLASTTWVSSWSSSDLAGLYEVFDQVVSTGVGGGFAVAAGIKSTAGLMAASSLTQGGSYAAVQMTLALKTAPPPPPSGGRFLLLL